MENGVKVRLNTDLTRYDTRLTIGQEGVTCDPNTSWGYSFGIGVQFYNGARLDVLESGLEILDIDYIARKAKERQKYLDALKEATDIEIILGPRGGFKYLSFRYKLDGIRRSTSTDFRSILDECMPIFEKEGLVIKKTYET